MEVGTTNKTHPQDYERALDAGAQLLLKVHTSNYAIVGFTEEVSPGELVALGRQRGCPVFYDMGSAFITEPGFPLPASARGMTVSKAVSSGVDLVCFSGDKLIGSAQAGILLGKKSIIDALLKNPLTRMLRIDKLSLAALECGLRAFADPAYARAHVPVVEMFSRTADELREKAEALRARLKAACAEGSFVFEVVPCADEAGGGTVPGAYFDGFAVAIEPGTMGASKLEAALRGFDPPIIGRIYKGRVLLCVRTLFEADFEAIGRAMRALV